MKEIIIPYNHQSIDQDDIQAVVEALSDNLITQGPYIGKFEEEVADYCEAKYAVAFCNGTAALHAACLALDIKAGDVGLVPPITFAATANCLRYIGAHPSFVDVTPGVPLMDPKKIDEAINGKTRVILPVHFAGMTVDMEELSKVAKKRGLFIIEDACHAFGSQYQTSDGKWNKVGSCRFSNMTVFSFHPVKNITTGEGGMITTNDIRLYQKLKQIRHHGIVSNSEADGKPAWHSEMQMLGYNYRMTDIQAALGISQLKKIDQFGEKKLNLLNNYREAFKDNPKITVLTPPITCRPNLHLGIMLLDSSLSRDDLFGHLRASGIGVQLHYIPVYRQPYYAGLGYSRPDSFMRSEYYYKRAISLPLYSQLEPTEQNYVIAKIDEWIQTHAHENSYYHTSPNDLITVAG